MKLRGKPYTPKTSLEGGSSRGPSSLSSALRCKRLVLFEEGERVTPRRSKESPARIGTAFHVLKLGHLAREAMESPPSWVFRPPLEVAREACAPQKLLKEEWLTARAMWDVDTKRGPPLDPKDWALIAVEKEVYATLWELGQTGPLKDEVVTSGIDLLYAHRRRNRFRIVDGKTEYANWRSKRLVVFNDEAPKWRMHWQAAVNIRIVQAMYECAEVDWCAYRISRAEPYDAALCKLELPPGLIDSVGPIAREAVAIQHRVLKMKPERVPMTGAATGECEKWSGCDFLPLCTAENSEIFETLLQEDFLRRG